MSGTENLIRSTDFAVFMKGCRGEWIAYPDSGRICVRRAAEAHGVKSPYFVVPKYLQRG